MVAAASNAVSAGIRQTQPALVTTRLLKLPGPKPKNPVSGRKPADPATHTRHNTGELQTQRRSGKAAFDRAIR